MAWEAVYGVVSLGAASLLFLTSGPGYLLLRLARFCSHIFPGDGGLTAFFFGTEARTRLRPRDPLMDIMADNPIPSLAFIKGVIGISFCCTALSTMPGLVYVLYRWSDCGTCDKSLRWWLLTNSLIGLIQLPLRLIFFLRLQYLSSQRLDQMALGVHHLTSSQAWSASKSLSLLNYAWFVLGIFWTFTTTECPAAPSLIYASVGVIALSLLRLLVTMGLFYWRFPHFHDPDGLRQARGGGLRRAPPLSHERVNLIGSSFYKEAATKLGKSPSSLQDVCPICLAEFVDQDRVRTLPQCTHYFHLHCIDRWLKIRGTCPLCQRAVNS